MPSEHSLPIAVGIALWLTAVSLDAHADLLPVSPSTDSQGWGAQIFYVPADGSQTALVIGGQFNTDAAIINKQYEGCFVNNIPGRPCNTGNPTTRPYSSSFTASADLATGAISFRLVNVNTSPTWDIAFGDALIVSIPNATPDTLTTITILHRLAGSATNAFQFTDTFEAGTHQNPVGGTTSLTPQNVESVTYHGREGNFVNPDNPTVDPTRGIWAWNGAYDVSAEVVVRGTSAIVPVGDTISFFSGEDATLDFSHTGTLAVLLPSGVTATSASGIFLSRPIPEPVSALFIFVGVGVVIMFRRAYTKPLSVLLNTRLS